MSLSSRGGGARAAMAAPRAAIADGPAASAPTAAAAAVETSGNETTGKAEVGSSGKKPRKNNQGAEFRKLAGEGYNLIPLYRRIFDDQLTPILAYRCLVKEDERDAPSFLLESVVGGTQTGRFSFLGSRPYMEAGRTRHKKRPCPWAQKTPIPCSNKTKKPSARRQSHLATPKLHG